MWQAHCQRAITSTAHQTNIITNSGPLMTICIAYNFIRILLFMQTLLLLCTLLSLTSQITFKCSPVTHLSNPLAISPVNDTCPDNSHCLDNGFCECNLGYIGGCTQSAYRLQDGL